MTTTALSIPAYAQRALAAGVRSALTNAATGGVGGNAPFPHISIKQSRWRLVDVEGEETIVKSFAIEFGVVSINPYVSKAFYLKKYSPGDDPTAPDCYSDDGKVPSQDADKIQSPSCGTCPNNVWGSDVNPTNGKKLKACKDAKRLSVMFLNLENVLEEKPEIYAWRLAAMSMINFSNFAKEVAGNGGALDFIVVRAEFDDTAEFPLVNYSVVRNMSEDEYNAIQQVRSSEEADLSVGIGRTSGSAPLVERVAAPAVDTQKVRNEVANANVRATQLAPVVDEGKAMADAIEAKLAEAAAHKAAVAKSKALQDARAAAAQVQKPLAEAATAAAQKKAFDDAVAKAVAARLAESDGGEPMGDVFPEGGEMTMRADLKQAVTDVAPKTRQRSPLNVVQPAAASDDMEDLLAAALR